MHCLINRFLNDKILDWSKLKAFAGDNVYAVQMMIYVLYRVENIVGNRENAGDQHFLGFTQCFQMPPGVPCGSVLKCLTRNAGILGSGYIGSSGFF